MESLRSILLRQRRFYERLTGMHDMTELDNKYFRYVL